MLFDLFLAVLLSGALAGCVIPGGGNAAAPAPPPAAGERGTAGESGAPSVPFAALLALTDTSEAAAPARSGSVVQIQSRNNAGCTTRRSLCATFVTDWRNGRVYNLYENNRIIWSITRDDSLVLDAAYRDRRHTNLGAQEYQDRNEYFKQTRLNDRAYRSVWGLFRHQQLEFDAPGELADDWQFLGVWVQYDLRSDENGRPTSQFSESKIGAFADGSNRVTARFRSYATEAVYAGRAEGVFVGDHIGVRYVYSDDVRLTANFAPSFHANRRISGSTGFFKYLYTQESTGVKLDFGDTCAACNDNFVSGRVTSEDSVRGRFGGRTDMTGYWGAQYRWIGEVPAGETPQHISGTFGAKSASNGAQLYGYFWAQHEAARIFAPAREVTYFDNLITAEREPFTGEGLVVDHRIGASPPLHPRFQWNSRVLYQDSYPEGYATYRFHVPTAGGDDARAPAETGGVTIGMTVQRVIPQTSEGVENFLWTFSQEDAWDVQHDFQNRPNPGNIGNIVPPTGKYVAKISRDLDVEVPGQDGRRAAHILARVQINTEPGYYSGVDYRIGGLWALVPDDASLTDEFEFGVFARANRGLSPSERIDRDGTAIYTGETSALYFETGTIRFLSGYVALTADFAAGRISGDADYFVDEDGNLLSLQLDFAETNLPSAYFSGGVSSGRSRDATLRDLTGEFHGYFADLPDAGFSAPRRVVGTYNAHDASSGANLLGHFFGDWRTTWPAERSGRPYIGFDNLRAAEHEGLGRRLALWGFRGTWPQSLLDQGWEQFGHAVAAQNSDVGRVASVSITPVEGLPENLPALTVDLSVAANSSKKQIGFSHEDNVGTRTDVSTPPGAVVGDYRYDIYKDVDGGHIVARVEAETTEGEADTTWRAAGIWAYIPDDETDYDAYELGVFAHAGSGLVVGKISSTRRAVYRGDAPGLYLRADEARFVTGEVALTANFRAEKISGFAGNFRDNISSEDIGIRLDFNETDIREGFFHGYLTSRNSSDADARRMQGAYTGNFRGGDGAEPGSIIGTFNAKDDAHLIGHFSAALSGEPEDTEATEDGRESIIFGAGGSNLTAAERRGLTYPLHYPYPSRGLRPQSALDDGLPQRSYAAVMHGTKISRFVNISVHNPPAGGAGAGPVDVRISTDVSENSGLRDWSFSAEHVVSSTVTHDVAASRSMHESNVYRKVDGGHIVARVQTEIEGNTDWLAAGIWAYIPDDETRHADYELGAFAHASSGLVTASINSTHEAVYSGGASGLYFRRDADVRHITGDVALTANFRDETIGGGADNFRSSVYNETFGITLSFGRTDIREGYFSGEVTSEASEEGMRHMYGVYSGNFHGEGAGGDNLPGSVIGVFDAKDGHEGHLVAHFKADFDSSADTPEPPTE